EDDRHQGLPALSADRRIRLLLHARGYAAHSCADSRRRGADHEGGRPLPHEREPGEVPRVSTAGAWEDFVTRLVWARGLLAPPLLIAGSAALQCRITAARCMSATGVRHRSADRP